MKQGGQTFTATYSGSNNYNQATATYSITVAPAEFGLTARDVSCTYDGQPHSITVTAAKGVTLTYCDTEGGEYTAAKPTHTNAGTYTTYFKATKGTETVTGSANVTISRATPKITFQCNHEETHGSGEEHSIQTTDLPLVLTIGGVPAQDQGQFTLTTFGDTVRNLKRNGNGTWTASPNLPPITRTYTFTAVFDPAQTQEGDAIGNPNYNRVTAAFTVTVSRPADEVIDFNFDFDSAVAKDTEVITKGTLTVPYDGERHSPLEALTYDKGLVLSYHVPVEYIDPDDNSGRATWTEEELKFQQPGEYTVSVMASPANSPVAKVLTVVLNIVDGEIATDLDMTPSETELTGGGELTLTVTGMPAAGRLTVTCDKNVKITETKRGTYTVTLPDRDDFYTFTASYSGAGSYQEAEASCTVNVTATASIGITLESLGLTAGDAEVDLSPAFDPMRTGGYRASVGYSVKNVTVAATGEGGAPVVVKKGGTVCAGGVVPLDEGKNTVIVTVSNGPSTTNYTVIISRVADKSALTDAIAAANTAKQGVAADNKTADRVTKGTKFVTTAEMKALTDTIATARAIAGKADATQAEVDAAEAALNAAVDAFEAAIKTGTYERPAGSGSAASSNPTTSSTLPVTTSTSNQNGTPITETIATPAASIKNGEATSTVNSTVGNEIVKQAADKNSDNVVIAPEIKGDVSKTEVSIPASTVEQIGKETNASLTVATPVASVTIPNRALNDLSKAGGNVKITAEQTGNTVELSVTAGGKTADSVPGGMKATVPVAKTTPGMVAVLVREDGSREVIRKSVANKGTVAIPLDGSSKVEIVDNSKRFADVPANNWAADAVSFVSSHELFNGTSRTTFSPELTMSRGMLAVVLHNLEDNPNQALTSIFSDVDNTKWYAQGVAWAAKKGIVTGYDGKFDPNGDITREQLAVMLWRYAGRPNAKNGTLNFIDADKVSSWALEAMRWATEKGIINGKGNGVLDPSGKATRAQAAQMLKNFMEKQ